MRDLAKNKVKELGLQLEEGMGDDKRWFTRVE